MSLFDWTDEYSVNVLTMDNHHKKLFSIMNQLQDAMKNGAGEETIGKLVDELVDYTKYHFNEEEKMLEKISYSGLTGQKTAHKIFVEKMLEYQKDVKGGVAILTAPRALKTCSSWLKEHILTVDTKYSSEANASGFS